MADAPTISISPSPRTSRDGADRAAAPHPEEEPSLDNASYPTSRIHQTHHPRSRPDKSNVKWHTKWHKHSFSEGRVLIIDYVSNAVPRTAFSAHKKQVAVAAEEIDSVGKLESFYKDRKPARDAALRVIHVQNATWATPFLLQRFNIEHPDDLAGMSTFGRWARFEKPRLRNGKPFPTGRSFRNQIDRWRNISRFAFGLDYLKRYKTPPVRQRSQAYEQLTTDLQLLHLNSYEDSGADHGWDIAVQRLSVYIQRKLPKPDSTEEGADEESPYSKTYPDDNVLPLDELDNGDTIIIFESSASLSVHDCLIRPRNDFETRWRQLSFLLAKEDAFDDARLAAQCTNLILEDVFHGLGEAWEEFLSAGIDHVAMLEDKIYEDPADESRAPELWTNQASWLKVEKIMWTHQDLVKEVQGLLREMSLAGRSDESDDTVEIVHEWLANMPAKYDKLSHSVQEDLVQPTTNLSDLMYKSVGIRDSRQGLQASLAMWRLSWITFLFLPLTFIVSFFGMNVDIFQNFPSVGWYFVAAVVLMLGVLFLWYCIKHSLQRRAQTPHQRSTYESLFHSLEDRYPLLWSSSGAREDIAPKGLIHRVQWYLLKRWFDPDKTVNKRVYNSLDSDDMDSSVSDRVKRYLLRRWIPKLSRQVARENDPLALEELALTMSPDMMDEQGSAIETLAKVSAPAILAEAEPGAVHQMRNSDLHPVHAGARYPYDASSRTDWDDRPDSRPNSAVMFEERNYSDSESVASVGVNAKKTNVHEGN